MAAPGLSCSTQDLRSSLWHLGSFIHTYGTQDLLVVAFELLIACGTRDQTRAPCVRSTESQPLDHQAILMGCLLTLLIVSFNAPILSFKELIHHFLPKAKTPDSCMWEFFLKTSLSSSFLFSAILCTIEFALHHVFSQDFQDQAIPGQKTKVESSHSSMDLNENW